MKFRLSTALYVLVIGTAVLLTGCAKDFIDSTGLGSRNPLKKPSNQDYTLNQKKEWDLNEVKTESARDGTDVSRLTVAVDPRSQRQSPQSGAASGTAPASRTNKNDAAEETQNENNSTSSIETESGETEIIDTEAMQQEREGVSKAIIETNKGKITVEFFRGDALDTVDNFLKLVQNEFYNGTKFHRVIQDFMIQGGDPNSRDDDWTDDGQGGPGYKFEDEINDHKLVRGALAMANSGPNTNGSQFFIVTAKETSWLDGKHTVFGEVTDGMDVVDEIEKAKTDQNSHPLEDIKIEEIEMLK